MIVAVMKRMRLSIYSRLEISISCASFRVGNESCSSASTALISSGEGSSRSIQRTSGPFCADSSAAVTLRTAFGL
jgi:hypothetical protein